MVKCRTQVMNDYFSDTVLAFTPPKSNEKPIYTHAITPTTLEQAEIRI